MHQGTASSKVSCWVANVWGSRLPTPKSAAGIARKITSRVAVEPVKSEENGLFQFKGGDGSGVYLVCAAGSRQEIGAPRTITFTTIEPARSVHSTVFFTDRSLPYRPGQRCSTRESVFEPTSSNRIYKRWQCKT